MNRSVLERRLRDFHGELFMSSESTNRLRQSILAIPEAYDTRNLAERLGLPRSWAPAIALAIVLLALLIAGAVAVGTGLIRVPWLTPDRSGLVGTECRIPQSLPEGRLIEFRVDGQNYIDGDVWGVTDGAKYTLFDDGLLVIQRERTRAQFRAAESQMMAGRLTLSGVRSLLDEIAQSTLLRSCLRGGYMDEAYGSITVRWESGNVTSAAWGRSYPGEFTYVLSDEEAERARRIEQLFAGPEQLGPGAVAAGYSPYDPTAWHVWIQRVIAAELPTYGDGPFTGPPSDDVVTPAGVALTRFGIEWREPGTAAELGREPERGRCAVVGLNDARALASALVESGASVSNHNWWLVDSASADDGDRLGVQIRPLLPPEDTCEEMFAAWTETSAPSASPTPKPSAVIGDLGPLDPCALLPSDGEVWDIESGDETIGPLGRQYRHCTAAWGSPGRVLAVRVHSTPLAEAATLAGEILGARLMRIERTDYTVWLNDCLAPEPFCGPSFAVSRAPFFIVVAFDDVYANDAPRDRTAVALELSAEVARRLAAE